MVQVITREWEIAKTYIYEVALRDGMIRLDWNDFEMKAWKNKPAVAVKVDDPLGGSEMSVKVIDEIKKYINNTLSSVIIIISYKKDQHLMMDELGGMNECLSRLAEEDVEINWGVQEADEITNSRSMTVFAFEKL